MDVGERIKEIREKREISNTELAKLCGIEQSLMSRIERNERRVDIVKLENICNALNVTLAEFFENEREKVFSNDLLKLIKCTEKLTPEQLKKLTAFIEAMFET